MTGRSNRTRSVAEEAAYWIIRCNEQHPLPWQERVELANWVKKSPQHIAELLRAYELDQTLSERKFPAPARPPASSVGPNVILMPPPVRKQVATRAVRRSRHTRKAAAAAAVVIFGALMAQTVLTHMRADVIKTGPGQLQTIALRDGSRIHVDERSELTVVFSRGRRVIDLRKGRAVFIAAKDVTRPFVVHTSVVDVTTDGTRFAVELDGGVTTTVLRGFVKITSHVHRVERSVTLAQGERLPVSKRGLSSDVAPKIAKLDAASVPGWMDGWSDVGARGAEFECKTDQSPCPHPQDRDEDAES